MRLIAHIDVDCFYVSCERVRFPYLKGKPVCVLGNQGAIVVASSYEAKKRGIGVGTPVWEAKKIYPDIVFLKRDFEWYNFLSSKMQKVFEMYSDVVEYYSIDESFLDLGNFSGDVYKLGEEMKSQMFDFTGLPVSVGISLNKTLSKMASDNAKPFGVGIVERENLETFLKESKLSSVSGIGKNLEEKLLSCGLKTAFDFVSKDRLWIKRMLNKVGEILWFELSGHFILPVREKRPMRKGISRGGSMGKSVSDKKMVFAFVVRHLERFVYALVSQGVEVRKISLILIDSSSRFFKKGSVLFDYTDSFCVLLKEFERLFFEIFYENNSYKSIHLLGEDVREKEGRQLSIFDFDDFKSKKISAVKKILNEKFGLFAVRSAETAYINSVFLDDANNFEISDNLEKFCF